MLLSIFGRSVKTRRLNDRGTEDAEKGDFNRQDAKNAKINSERGFKRPVKQAITGSVSLPEPDL